MVDKNEAFDKKINKNYGAVQKKEILVAEGNVKMAKEFTTNTANFSKELKKELSAHTTYDKGIKKKFVVSVKELNVKHTAHLKDIESRNKDFNNEFNKDLQNSLDKFNTENKKLNDLVILLKKDNEKTIEDTLNLYNKDVENSELEKSNIIELSEKEINNLLSALKDTQDKYETLVVSLNEKREAKLDKLNTASTKKSDKYTIEIDKEQAKADKSINDLKPPFEEKLSSIEEKLAAEKAKYQKREGAIKSTLESKVARHEKFMNKSLRDNDQRAVKQHKKEISVLEKNADRELKILAKEHNDKYGVLNNKKRDLITTNKNKVAVFETDLVKFKEEKLYQIEHCKVTLADDLEITGLVKKQQLEDELNKYNEYFADNARKQAGIIKIKDMDIEKQVDIQVNLKTAFDKVNKIDEVKYQEAQAVKENEFKISEITKASEDVLAQLILDVELAKLENEKVISEKELVLSIGLSDENELIEYQNNDHNKQTSINKEYLNHQKELSNLYNKRANLISEYEDLELNNRANLKMEFLNHQKTTLIKDYEGIVEKINNVFESEKVMFELEINKLAKQALEDLATFELEGNEKIKVMVDKRNAFNPRAYKKEIKVLDREITENKATHQSELNKRREAIDKKTMLFKIGLEGAVARKEKAIQEVESLNNSEQARIDYAVELLNKEKSDELSNVKERLSSTVADANNFYTQAEERNKTVTEENTVYKEKRVEKEEVIIKETKNAFEQDKHVLTSELEQALVILEKQKAERNEETKKQKLKEEELLESKVKGYDSQITNHNQSAENLDVDQKNVFRTNVGRIEMKYNNEIASIANELNKKTENYRDKTVDIDRATNNEQKEFDTSKKKIQKDYDSALSKGLSTINQKLQQDLKNI